MKSKIFALAFLAYIIQACALHSIFEQSIPWDTAEKIPLNSRKVVVVNTNTIKDNFTKCRSVLRSQGFKIEGINKEKSYISAVRKYEDAVLQLTIKCDNQSVIMVGTWKHARSFDPKTSKYLSSINISLEGEIAVWNGEDDYASVAFSKIVQVGKKLGEVTYQ